MGWRGDPVWLADVLRAAGLTVVEMPGWLQRGHGDFGDIWGIVCHHTGSNNASPQSIAFHPTLGLASQIHLARNGVATMCGVGIAWHAGIGSWPGLPTNGANSRTIGIEAANDGGGSPGKPHRSSWPDSQYDAYVRICAAILRKLGYGVDHVIGHKEWAGAAQGKWDPGAIDMHVFRSDAQWVLGGSSDSVEAVMATNQEKLDFIYNEMHKLGQSRSIYRTANKQIETQLGFVYNTDAMEHMRMVDDAAARGEKWAVETVRACADGALAGSFRWQDGKPDEWARQHARDVLKSLEL